MPDLPELRLKPSILERYQLPDIGYPIPIEQLEQVISGGGHFPLALLLQGLQQKNQAKDADREALEPAIKRLKELLRALTDGAALPEALATAKAILRNEHEHEETLQALEQAEALAATELPHHQAITRLGQGWIAEEALAISVYCALVV